MSNNISRSTAPNSVFESAINVIDSTISIDQGQHCFFDTSAHLIKPVAAEADCATYVGVSRVKIVSGKVASPYNTDVVASQGISDVPGPQFGVVANCLLKTGETLTAGQLMYADPATGIDGVAGSGTKAIGVYQGAAITTSAAGVRVNVAIGHRYPADTLVL